MLNKIREEFGFSSIDDNNTACKILMTKTELKKSLDFVSEERERLQRELEDYKSRIEKAINYIKSDEIDVCTIKYNDIYDTKKDLLNILNGKE